MDSALGFDARRLPVSGAGSPFVVLLLATLMAFVPTGSGALVQNSEITPAVHPEAAADELAEIMVETREPRFVAPTLRDQIGRIWAPVFINGRGPFRLVLDTGASHSGVTAMVALALGIPTDQAPAMLLHGVTGQATVPAIHVDSLSFGDLDVAPEVLPIVPDALGGAQGVLGSEGLANKRIFIDFRHDQIKITYSRGERAGYGFVDVPFRSIKGQLIVVDAMVGRVHCKGIIDTGGQTTIGNLALRRALSATSATFGFRGKPDVIQGATLDIEPGELLRTPPIQFGPVQILDYGVTYADLYIFKQWKMTAEPAILIGMDALGTLDTFIIDYRRHELQLKMSRG
ncbi:MAG TPA: retropepsin-like aspartic protease [Steroidobacteraceae bacterium]|nr:retropepsin-like aspartic protease [Steroidobacteraceae bacterium]